MEFKFDLLEKENVGEITLGNKVRVSDPCYDIDTWCAGTLENVLEGNYKCFSQSVDSGDWGVRVASIEVVHEDYLNIITPTELQNIDVGVDSGQAGIYDLDYFIKARADKHGKDKWYKKVCDITYKYIENPDYVPFYESEFCTKTEHKIIDHAIENNFPTDNISETEFIDYFHAWKKYDKDKCSVKEIGKFTASTLDGKCLVSSSGDGDGGYHCFVGRNNEGKIVSIKIDYYYGYESDEVE